MNTLNDGHERKLILDHDEVKAATGMEIGGGAYGRVFEVEYKGTLCTAREVDSLQSIFAQGDDKVLQDSFLSKYHTWSTLHHPCIVQFIGMVFVNIIKYLQLVKHITPWTQQKSITHSYRRRKLCPCGGLTQAKIICITMHARLIKNICQMYHTLI